MAPIASRQPIWLARPGAHKVYVTLCYSQCLTDLVPIAGQQCAPDEANSAPSRILQSVYAAILVDPAAAAARRAGACLGALLRQIEIIDDTASLPAPDDSAALKAAVRALAADLLPLESLPASGPFHLSAADADATIREALTIWVTEISPHTRPAPEKSPLLDSTADDCVLLVEIDFTIGNDGQLVLSIDAFGNLVPGDIVIDETQRPVLVPTRLLQEVLHGSGTGPLDGGQLTGTVTLTPGGSWSQFTTLYAPLPDGIAPDAAIELAIESSTPELLGPTPATTGNLALTLYRPPPGSLPGPAALPRPISRPRRL